MGMTYNKSLVMIFELAYPSVACVSGHRLAECPPIDGLQCVIYVGLEKGRGTVDQMLVDMSLIFASVKLA